MPASSPNPYARSEEHTSELQSRSDLVCRLLLEKKKKKRKVDKAVEMQAREQSVSSHLIEDESRDQLKIASRKGERKSGRAMHGYRGMKVTVQACDSSI